MDENMVTENIEETVDEVESNEESNLIGKIIVGGITIATGAAVGFAIKNRGRIKDGFLAAKEARRQKKVKKAMDRLAKLEAKAPKPVEAEKE